MQQLNSSAAVGLLLILSTISSFTTVSIAVKTATTTKTKQNPITPKASLICYWNKHISNNLPKPYFLLSKASPLSAADSAFFTKLASQQSLSSHLSSFCSAAKLFCRLHSKPAPQKHAEVFTDYSPPKSRPPTHPQVRGNSGNKVVVSGKFFREYMLKEGNVMKMPDIRDMMPKRSFLPRSISSKLPFSRTQLHELKQVFRVMDNSTMELVLVSTVEDCERALSPGETRRCVGSVEDMIDFSVLVLGHNVVARTTENINGWKKNVMLGKVEGVNGGKLTKSVLCHQSLYPYLVYYCHSVPKVRVYKAEILDVDSRAKINHGVAICHEDTSAWSPCHVALVALGSSPGLIEVCHWIRENDMIWTIAD